MGKRVDAATSERLSRHLRWESFATRISRGPPSIEPVKGTPKVHFFIEPNGRRIGARFFQQTNVALSSPLAEVAIRQIGQGAGSALEISTGNPLLYADFYSLCCLLADRVQIGKQPIVDAVQNTLSAWASILRKKLLLSQERQVGLLGELLFLRRAAGVIGWPAAVSGWYGPDSEEHDFVLPAADVEVKTTLQEHRIHHISSLTQLLPKQGRRLQFVSIQLTHGGDNRDAFSLPETVATVLSEAARSNYSVADLIREQLQLQGWADEDAPQYETRYYMRAPILSIQVTDGFPAVVPATLVSLGSAAVRINGMVYSINVDGLGVQDGTPQFSRHLFGTRKSQCSQSS